MSAACCAWCLTEIENPAPGQLYCGATHARKVHRQRAKARSQEPRPETPEEATARLRRELDEAVCRRKEDYLTEEAAAAAVRIRSQPGLGRELEYYPCPVGEHFHLRSKTKREARQAVRQIPA